MFASESTEAHTLPKRKPIRLTTEEVRDAFQHLEREYPPILSLDEAAKLARIKPSTLKRKVSEGHFADCVRRGKPLRFWRDALVKNLFH